MLFAALHKSASGPSRPISHQDVTSAFGGEAEVGRAAKSAASVENDPNGDMGGPLELRPPEQPGRS